MMSNLIPFEFESHAVRVIERDGEPWFVLADVCRVLEIANSRDAAARLDDDEKADVGITDTSSNGVAQRREMTIINESGLYSLVLTSRKPSAKRFKKWVTAEVLPSIRKTGSYGSPALIDLSDPVVLVGLLTEHATKRIEAEQRAAAAEKVVEAQRGDVEALERIAKSDGSLCITDAAKALQIRPKELFDYLKANGWIYRRLGSDHWIGYQVRVNAGDLEHKVTTVQRADGSDRTTEQVRITPQGLAKLAKVFTRPLLAV